MKRECRAIFLASVFIISQSGFAQCTTCTITDPAVLPDPIPAGTFICITSDQSYDGHVVMTGGAIHVCSGATLRINGSVDMDVTSEITTIDCSKVEVNGNIDNNNPLGLRVIDNCDCPNSITATGPIFGFGVICSPLPVELVNFNVHLTGGNNVLIDWATASETNNAYFIVERSIDLQKWYLVTTVDGAGNSNHLINYTTSDVLNEGGTYYYRLTQVDYDGKSETFNYKTLTSHSIQSVFEVNIFPNPVSEFVTLSLNGNVDTDLTVEIMNLSGQVISTSVIAKGSSREQKLSLDGFESGIFVIRITGGSVSQSSKLIISKN